MRNRDVITMIYVFNQLANIYDGRTKCSRSTRQEQYAADYTSLSVVNNRKSNLLFNAQKIQKNPIFQISVDILSNTNFFRAFTASASIPAIYVQQFWNTMKYDEKTGVYSCQVDEQWFDLSVDL
ncbi:hypothetical protein Tco_0424807 [Tanacetum coccineum]